MTAIDEVIENSTDSINSSKILKNRQEKKDDRNPKSLYENGEKKSPEALGNSIIISDKEENTNILDPRLKKTTSFSQARYNFIYLINITY